MLDLLNNLNAEQLQAVTLPAQAGLILAGAGSGKTRVLTTRIAWLIKNDLATPHNILAVTFTNKAAKEMLSRLHNILPSEAHGLWMGTFHGLCHRILRNNYLEADLPQSFQILDMQDQQGAIKRLLKNLNFLEDEKFSPKKVQLFINKSKEQGLRPDKIICNDSYTRTMQQLYSDYQIQCQRDSVVDFAELLLRCYELLSNTPKICNHYQERWRYILIDEFQDTNKLQYAWIKLLAGYNDTSRLNNYNHHKTSLERPIASVLAVGDDDQSIYAFRGADSQNMNLFIQEFSPILVKLEQNYRSYGHILNSANLLIANNTDRLGKELYTKSELGQLLQVYQANNDTLEANWLAKEISNLIANGINFRDIGILYRSNAQSRVLEHALFFSGLPYRVYGGLRFFERAEIKHALAYLRLLVNPDDDTSFLRVVNFPVRGIGDKAIESLQAIALERNCSLHSALNYLSGSKFATALRGFGFLLEKMRLLAIDFLPELITKIISESGLLANYAADKEAREKTENLAELNHAARAFLKERGLKNIFNTIEIAENENLNVQTENANKKETITDILIDFLSHVCLESDDHHVGAEQIRIDGQADDKSVNQNNVINMMTVHAAKGLEFNVVFITGLEEGLFPHESSSSTPKDLEEERRLMYVAITRARNKLYLSYSKSRMLHGQIRSNKRSRFMNELPSKSLQWQNTASNLSSAPYEVKSQIKKFNINASNDKYIIGQKVLHATFGQGSITALSGAKDDVLAQIKFAGYGLKWLDLSIAKLKVV